MVVVLVAVVVPKPLFWLKRQATASGCLLLCYQRVASEGRHQLVGLVVVQRRSATSECRK